MYRFFERSLSMAETALLQQRFPPPPPPPNADNKSLESRTVKRGCSVCGVSLSFFVYEVLQSKFCRRANFAGACLMTLSNRFYKSFFPKRSLSPGKRQNWILLFYQSGRTSIHVENILLSWSRGRVAHSFNLLHNVLYRTTERTTPNR